MAGTGDASREGPVLRGRSGPHRSPVRGPGPQATVARHGSLLPCPSESARNRDPPPGLRGGGRLGIARARGLVVAWPAREDGRWQHAADPGHGPEPGSLAPGTHAKTRPGVSHPAARRLDLLGHGRLVRAGDGTVQGQGDGRAGLARASCWTVSSAAMCSWATALTPRTSCWRCCWRGAWTW